MGSCRECGKQDGLSFTCDRCGRTYCTEHRLPEKHICAGGQSKPRSRETTRRRRKIHRAKKQGRTSNRHRIDRPQRSDDRDKPGRSVKTDRPAESDRRSSPYDVSYSSKDEEGGSDHEPLKKDWGSGVGRGRGEATPSSSQTSYDGKPTNWLLRQLSALQHAIVSIASSPYRLSKWLVEGLRLDRPSSLPDTRSTWGRSRPSRSYSFHLRRDLKIVAVLIVIITVVYFTIGPGFANVQATWDDGAPFLGGMSGDTDGDRIPDAWEQTGQTDTGVPVPEADPERKDLYVIVLYSDGVKPMSGEEKRNLRRTWANMPVDNPDGSTGVDLHIVDSEPIGGQLNSRVYADGQEGMEHVMRQTYDDTDFGGRECLYHVAVAADVEGQHGGIGTAPGYTVVFDGNGRFRSDMLTHELLHNIVGTRVGSESNGHHTTSGMLAAVSGPSNAMSTETVDALSEGFQSTGEFATKCG